MIHVGNSFILKLIPVILIKKSMCLMNVYWWQCMLLPIVNLSMYISAIPARNSDFGTTPTFGKTNSLSWLTPKEEEEICKQSYLLHFRPIYVIIMIIM